MPHVQGGPGVTLNWPASSSSSTGHHHQYVNRVCARHAHDTRFTGLPLVFGTRLQWLFGSRSILVPPRTPTPTCGHPYLPLPPIIYPRCPCLNVIMNVSSPFCTYEKGNGLTTHYRFYNVSVCGHGAILPTQLIRTHSTTHAISHVVTDSCWTEATLLLSLHYSPTRLIGAGGSQPLCG